jgi:hypothetical protein
MVVRDNQQHTVVARSCTVVAGFRFSGWPTVASSCYTALRKGSRHGCTENRNGGKVEQHGDDGDDDTGDVAFEECVSWKL